jgi:hypothetical protein
MILRSMALVHNGKNVEYSSWYLLCPQLGLQEETEK